MAFTFTVNTQSPDGVGVGITTGTYKNDGSSTGGVINTGFNKVYYFDANCQTSQAADMNYCLVSGASVTLTTVANETGQWMAIGQ